MSRPIRTMWQSADEPYYHPDGSAWRVRSGRWGGLRVPMAAGQRAALTAFSERSGRFNAGAAIPVMLDDAAVLGHSMGHTSRVRWIAGGPVAGGKVLLVYVRNRARSIAYTVCHEVVHNLLYADGLTRLSAPPHATAEDTALISHISTSTSHPLVVRQLEHFGWAVTRHEAERAEGFLRAASASSHLGERAAALIAAEFAVVLGSFWLDGARAALRRFGPLTEALAHELVAGVERCVDGVDAVQAARESIVKRLLLDVDVTGVNPLERVAGPGEARRHGRSRS